MSTALYGSQQPEALHSVAPTGEETGCLSSLLYTSAPLTSAWLLMQCWVMADAQQISRGKKSMNDLKRSIRVMDWGEVLILVNA